MSIKYKDWQTFLLQLNYLITKILCSKFKQGQSTLLIKYAKLLI